MSKNRNKKAKNAMRKFAGNDSAMSRIGGSASMLSDAEMRDADGFLALFPNPDSESYRNFIAKGSKKATVEIHEEVSYDSYDPSTIKSQVNSCMDAIKTGKFSKAFDTIKKATMDEFIDAFLNMDISLPNWEKVLNVMTDFLKCTKSFYEYDEKHRELVPNTVYDQILAKYMGTGHEEPTGIVPNTGKKTGINYPTLHNNMDKAYILREGDLIPDGVKEQDSVEKFLRRAYESVSIPTSDEITIEISPKIDGVSVNGTMYKKCLLRPQTRGDMDASVSIPGLNGISLGDKNTEEFGIQYECFVLDEDREKASEYLNLDRPYVSNRHAASGMINRLTVNDDDELLKFLSFYPIEAEGLDMSYPERMKFLQKFGCMPDDMIERETITGSLDKLLDTVQKKFEKFSRIREKLSYSIDGMVITIVDQNIRDAMGRKGRSNQYQVGYKFDPANARAEVKEVCLDAGRKGFRTIQVYFENPVFLDGVRYDHVPVLSAQLFEDLKLRKGSIVNVHRVGDVIPSISMIEAGNGKKLDLPEVCPDCGEKLMIKNKKLFCENSECSGNRVGKYLGFLDALGLDGYGEAFVQELLKNFDKKLTGFSFLAELTVEDLKKAGMDDKLSREFPEKIRAALQVTPDYKIIGAMGWPDVGPARAKEILKCYEEASKAGDNNEAGIDELIGVTEMKIIASPFLVTFLGKVGQKIDAWFSRHGAEVGKDLKVLRKYMGNITTDFSADKYKVGHTGGELSTRVVELCKDLDYEITDGSKFDVLITADKNSDSGKMQKARKKNLPIYTEEEFLDNFK